MAKTNSKSLANILKNFFHSFFLLKGLLQSNKKLGCTVYLYDLNVASVSEKMEKFQETFLVILIQIVCDKFFDGYEGCHSHYMSDLTTPYLPLKHRLDDQLAIRVQ